MSKPRVIYAEFLAQKVIATEQAAVTDFQPGSFARLIQRFINEMDGVGCEAVKPLSESHRYALLRIQRSWLGKKQAAKLTKHDWKQFAKERVKSVAPSTVMQDFCFCDGVLKYAPSEWDDCEDVSNASLKAARPSLVKHGVIAKGRPRTRRPTDEEHVLLLELATKQNRRPRNKINMYNFIRWQRASSRRLSESCRAMWGQWDKENHTLLVLNMKDPKSRDRNEIVALPKAAQALLIEMEPHRLRPDDPTERIFPYYHKSVGIKYTLMKQELAEKYPGLFLDLHLHDSRRDCGSRLQEIDGYSSEEAILVTGHKTIKEYERTYRKMKPELFHLGPISQRLAAAKGAGRT